MWLRERRRAHERPALPAALLPAALLLVTWLMGGCGPAAGAAKPEAGGAESSVVVFAASSLTDAFLEIAALYEERYPGSRVQYQFGGSSQLRLQLEQGAEADVFVPASLEQMEQARAAGLVRDPVQIFARNRLVIIAPAGNPAGIVSLEDLARPGVRLVTAAPEVPIGAYTLEMLDRADQDGAFGAGFKERVLANVVSRELNVRQVVAKVRLGEADAAVVYASDVTPDVRPHVGVVEVPGAYNVTAAYPIAVLNHAPNPAGAQDFVDLALGPEGRRVLETWGFLPAAGGEP